MRLRIDSSPSMWITSDLYTILSITASAIAPSPNFACHPAGENWEQMIKEPVLSLDSTISSSSRAWSPPIFSSSQSSTISTSHYV